jgi:hypothetical protein
MSRGVGTGARQPRSRAKNGAPARAEFVPTDRNRMMYVTYSSRAS